MKQLTYVTGNQNKFTAAQYFCAQKGIELSQAVLDIDEIQSEDGEKIVLDKGHKAYKLTGQPVIVSDHFWSIDGLGGFPGAYMKSINHWFTPQNFIDLTTRLENRQVTLTEYMAYVNGSETKVFVHKRYGKLLHEPRGISQAPWEQVVAMNEHSGLSVAEVFEQGKLSDHKDIWQGWEEFAAWFLGRNDAK